VIQAEGRETQQHQAFCFEEDLDEGICLEMVTIPGGYFEMGSPETEGGRDLHESPLHFVNISPFALSRFLITQAQWKAIAALPKIKRALNLYPSDFEGDDRPVEQISWYDAIEFCARLSHKTGQAYRLPSEAEWEYACRAGTTTPFHFGETITSDLANYDGNYTYRSGTAGVYRQGTTPRISIANPFGLSDMHGNLWEWCADAWHDTYEGAPTDGSVWEAEEGATYRVLRGGAWYCLPELCRSAQRHWNQPDLAGSGIGFRVVCAAA
jgi:formylglycine-generating enzyme required for sulfatase activity